MALPESHLRALGWEKLAPGVWATPAGEMHIFPRDMLRAEGQVATPENIEAVREAVRRVAKCRGIPLHDSGDVAEGG